jgi:WD40 repeat protein
MEFIPGKSLEQLVREHPMGAREAAQYTRQIAEAVQHAHDHGVLHRDLKPSNILVDADEQPRITDFGIARIAGTETTTSRSAQLTRTGQSLGSPGYAAPEQALAGVAEVRTDVYGLGALLYHLLTGRPPFQGPTLDAILMQLRENDPLSPRRLNPSVPRDLETICLKCLHKQPEGRYVSATAVAEDLSRFLDGNPIFARPLSSLGKAWRWTRRHPGIAALLTIIALLIAGIVVGSLALARHQSRMEHRSSLLSEARSLRQMRFAGTRNDALLKLSQAWAIAPSAEIRNEVIACLALPEISAMRLGNVKPPPRPKLTLPAVPEGAMIALDDARQRVAVAVPESGSLRILSSKDGRVLFTCEHPQAITSVDWSGDLIATGCDNRFIYIWDDHGKLKHRLSGHQATPVQVRFRPRSQELVSTARDVYVRLWHAARGEEILRRETAHQPHTSLWWSADGRHLHAATDTGKVESYDFHASPCMQLLSPPQEEPHTENLGSADLSADGRLAFVVDEEMARVWDFARGRLIQQIPRVPGQWLGGQFSPDGSQLWTCGWSHELSTHAIQRSKVGRLTISPPQVRLSGHGSLLRDMSADGQRLVLSNNGAGKFIVASADGGKALMLDHPGTLATAIDPAGRWVITTSYQTSGARLWSLPEGRLLRTLCEKDTVMQAVALGREQVIFQTSGRARVFKTSDWTEERGMPEKLRLTCMAASTDGRLLAVVGENDVRLLETQTFAETMRLTLPAHVGWLGECHLVFDSDASHLLIHTALGSVVRWDLEAMDAELGRMGMN